MSTVPRSAVETSLDQLMEDAARAARDAAYAARRRPSAKVMWVNDRFKCTGCKVHYCAHIRRFFQQGDDVGMHGANFSRHMLHSIRVIYLPLANNVLVGCKTTVVEHPGNPDQTMLYLCESREASQVSMFISRDDSFEPFIRELRDYYFAQPITRECFERIKAHKRLPCTPESHNRASDLALVREIKMASERVDQLDQLENELWGIALENAYFLTTKGHCAGCEARRIDPSNIPDDLIPSV